MNVLWGKIYIIACMVLGGASRSSKSNHILRQAFQRVLDP
jgi:hypothetical protein